MPDKKDLIDEYNRFYTNNPAIWISNKRNEFALKTINDHMSFEPKTVLDIGCGNGHTINYFAEHWKESRFTGLDISPVALKISKYINPDQEFVQGFIGEVDLPKFYCVMLLGVAEHFEDLQAGLQAVRDVTRKDGVCYMEIPNCIGYPDSHRQEGFRRLEFGSQQWEWHLFRETWDKELEKAGFKIVKSLTGINIFSEFCYLLEVA